MSRRTGNRVNSNYERIASRIGVRFRTRASESQRHFPPLTAVPNDHTTRPWPNHQNRIGISWRYHTLNTTASRFWAGTILHCLHVVLVYRYYYVIWYRHEHYESLLKLTIYLCYYFSLRLFVSLLHNWQGCVLNQQKACGLWFGNIQLMLLIYTWTMNWSNCKLL